MAVHDRDSENNNQSQQRAQGDQGYSTGQAARDPVLGANPQQSEQGKGGGGFGFGRNFKRHQMGESLQQLVKHARKIVVEQVQKDNYYILPIDGSRCSLHYSAVAFVSVEEIDNTIYASTYTMILEDSAPEPRPIITNLNGAQIEIMRTAMDAWDTTTWNKVVEIVRDALGDVEVINAGATTLPASFDALDEVAVNPVLWNADEATRSALETMFPENYKHFDINQHIDKSTSRVTASFKFNEGDAQSITGAPIRSDITMRLATTDAQNNNRNDLSSFQHSTTQELVEVNAFTDLVFAPPQQQPAYGQQQITQMFVPRLVITRITALDHAPYTPETFLLGLATSALVTENFSFAAQFKGRIDDRNDIGNIGHRIPNPQDNNQPYGKFDTTSNTFGDNELHGLLAQYVHAVPAISIDCEMVGPESWLTTALIEAASGNPGAHQWIVDAANRLTGNAFNHHYDGSPIIASEGNRIHIGTFTDTDKQVRDLREIDSLAILNIFGEDNPGTADTWEDTHNNASIPVEARLDRRLSILRQAINGAPRIRGLAERLTFTPAFLSALIAGVKQAGLMVDQDGLHGIYGNQANIGNTFIQQHAFQGNAGGMVNQGGVQGLSFNRNNVTRW